MAHPMLKGILMKTLLLLILVALSLAACGGEPFGADFSDTTLSGAAGSATAAGEAGRAVTGDAGDTGAGDAGAPTGGTNASAGATAGGAAGSAGSPPVACKLDAPGIAALLPAIVWHSWGYNQDGRCGSCQDQPCASFAPTWNFGGEDTGGLHYGFGAAGDVKLLVGKDAGCAAPTSCTAEITGAEVVVQATREGQGFRLKVLYAEAHLLDNACLEEAGVPPQFFAPSLTAEVKQAVDGLEIPCD